METILDIHGVKKAYGKIIAVDNVSFCVEEGELIGLLGPNGAGKSTTISMIATLFKPDSGTIKYRGKDIAKNPKSIQKELGIVPQDIALYLSLTGKENLKFWGQAYGLSGTHLKKRMSVVSEIIGIDKRLSDKVSTYSGGMKRRLNIGVALLHEPKILIMDEPTVGIDPQSRKHILDTVLKLNREGVTVVYTSHYMDEVETLCNKIHIMDKGKIIASGTQEELIQTIEKGHRIAVTFDALPLALLKEIEHMSNDQTLEQEGTKVTFHAKNSGQAVQSLINVSSLYNVCIETIETTKPDLEAVFLHLTGKELRD